jgi:hypothetical protein
MGMVGGGRGAFIGAVHRMGAQLNGKIEACQRRVAIPVRQGDVVLIDEGYHPVVKAPCTNGCSLNFLAEGRSKDFGGQRSFSRLGEQEMGRQPD